MKSLFNIAEYNEIIERLNQVLPSSVRQWGTMEPSQMLAHCSAALEVALGIKHPPRLFIGKIMGWMAKPLFTGSKPFKKGSPTDKSFIITSRPDFEMEKSRLKQYITNFYEGGEAGCTTHPHSFFGKLTPKEWSIGMYKHLDHHFRQFNV